MKATVRTGRASNQAEERCVSHLQVRLRREKVALSPVYYTALQSDAIQSGPLSGFSLAAAPALTDSDSEPVVTSSSLFGRRAATDGYSSTAHGRLPLPAQPAAVGGSSHAAARQEAGQGSRWGYLRLTSFSQNAAEETKHAIQSLEVGGGVLRGMAKWYAGLGRGEAGVGFRGGGVGWAHQLLNSLAGVAMLMVMLVLNEIRRPGTDTALLVVCCHPCRPLLCWFVCMPQRKGVSGYILDLRDNPGGLVKAGLDIARLLMDGHPTVFSIVGRTGEPEQKVGGLGPGRGAGQERDTVLLVA